MNSFGMKIFFRNISLARKRSHFWNKHYDGDKRHDDETVIDTDHAGFRERNPQWASKGAGDKRIRLVFTISPATFV